MQFGLLDKIHPLATKYKAYEMNIYRKKCNFLNWVEHYENTKETLLDIHPSARYTKKECLWFYEHSIRNRWLKKHKSNAVVIFFQFIHIRENAVSFELEVMKLIHNGNVIWVKWPTTWLSFHQLAKKNNKNSKPPHHWYIFGEFVYQRTNAESVSMSWRYHGSTSALVLDPVSIFGLENSVRAAVMYNCSLFSENYELKPVITFPFECY